MNDKKYLFIDYEGTLSQSPVGSGENGKVILQDLLFGDVYSSCKPVKKVKDFLKDKSDCEIYVIGVIDTYNEIQHKIQWLKKYYPLIKIKNCIFISGDHKKVDVLNEFVKKNNLNIDQITFIDDREKHLLPAIEQGYKCINVNQL